MTGHTQMNMLHCKMGQFKVQLLALDALRSVLLQFGPCFFHLIFSRFVIPDRTLLILAKLSKLPVPILAHLLVF